MIRLFIGIKMPSLILDQLEMMACGLRGARWVPRDNIHLTLRFIGDVDGGVFRELKESLDELRFPPLQMQLQDLGYFKRGRQIHTLWVGVAENPTLNKLKNQIDRQLADVDLTVDRRKYVPHVTLARLKDAHPERVAQFIHNHSPLQSPVVTIDAFHLYSSALSDKGAHYTIEQSYPLATSERERIQKLMALEQEEDLKQLKRIT